MSTLRRVEYEILPPVGPGSFSTEGSVADLLFDIPYFFLAKIIPPMQVVNNILQKGILDAGMSGGCKWEPFQLDVPSYATLASELERMEFVAVPPPDWVTTHQDWHTWCAELVWGIPALEARQKWAEITELEARFTAATEAGDKQLAGSLYVQVNQLSARYVQFLERHRGSEARLPLFRRPSKKQD